MKQPKSSVPAKLQTCNAIGLVLQRQVLRQLKCSTLTLTRLKNPATEPAPTKPAPAIRDFLVPKEELVTDFAWKKLPTPMSLTLDLLLKSLILKATGDDGQSLLDSAHDLTDLSVDITKNLDQLAAQYKHISKYFTLTSKVTHLRASLNDAMAKLEGIPNLYAEPFRKFLKQPGRDLRISISLITPCGHTHRRTSL
ncbi:uncharacterized protein N7483_010545 [Penicillium malachiteum]|uniref:uncharacterized protein n=1 Tax=Penicillium malachiteum TaxID=1324776 RepID=UPI002549263C|nr:uncharacterized protein N7483_010545 [Penicillium malachiteum]KAJ5713364.1 hypothetical protein N7483_010545 [Penicillium malachiteum]